MKREVFPDAAPAEHPTSEEHVSALERMAANGLSEAPVGQFRAYVEQHKLNVEDIMTTLVKQSFGSADMASDGLVDVANILEIYTQAMPDKAGEFLRDMLSLECHNPADFLTKYRFIQVVQRYAFGTLWLPSNEPENQTLAGRDPVYQALVDAAQSESGSYLLQQYTAATLRRLRGEESLVEVDQFQWSPVLVAPRQYGFDTEASFWLTLSHGNTDPARERGMYISNPSDYEELTTLLSGITEKGKKLMSQEDYERLAPFFHRLTRAEIDPVADAPDEPVGRQGIRLAEYRTLTQPFFHDEISRLVGVESLQAVDLRAQFQLFAVVKNYDRSQVERLRAFAEQYGQAGLQTFLSLAHGDPNVAEHIFAIAEKLPSTAAKTVFRTYGDIVGAVDQMVDILGDQPGATPELLQVIQTNLYHQGVRLLEEYGAEAATCAEQACADVGRKLEERLALAKSSVFAMGAVTRQLVKDGAFSFENFSQLSLVQDTPPLSEELAKQIRTMHQANTDQYPESLRDYWRGTLAEALESEDADQKFVYVTMGKDVLAVMRVIDQGDYWYGASFNVNPTIQGSRVGSELLKKVIADMGSQKPFVADVYAENPMLDNYLNTFGFKITDTDPNYHDTSTVVHQITWEKPD